MRGAHGWPVCVRACASQEALSDLTKRFRLDELAGKYDDARARAKQISKRHAKDDLRALSMCDPSTNVWEFVDLLGVRY
jgi:hypothetical protein